MEEDSADRRGVVRRMSISNKGRLKRPEKMVRKEKKNLTLTFGISHPNLDPRIITDTIGLYPDVVQRAGEGVVTPQGEKVPSKYSHTNWTHVREVHLSEDNAEERADEELISLINELYDHRVFLSDICKSGGDCSVYYFIPQSCAFVVAVPLETSKKMNEMQIEFSFQVFK